MATIAQEADTHFADDTFMSMLVEHENALADLYKVFQETIPADFDFWGKMVAAEIGHANLLRRLKGKIDSASVEVNRKIMKMSEIRASLYFLKAEIQRAKGTKPRAEEAYAMALRSENTIVEQEFFRIFKTDVPEIQKAFDKILEDSQQHYLMIENRAENPPKRPEWMRTLYGTLRRKL